MSKGKKVKWQGSVQTRYGDAGPPVQHGEKLIITLAELKEVIKVNDIKADKLFSKEEILNDPKVKAHVENEILIQEKIAEKEAKERENDMIPGGPPTPLTDEQKRQQEKDNEFVADGKGEPGENDLIPD